MFILIKRLPAPLCPPTCSPPLRFLPACLYPESSGPRPPRAPGSPGGNHSRPCSPPFVPAAPHSAAALPLLFHRPQRQGRWFSTVTLTQNVLGGLPKPRLRAPQQGFLNQERGVSLDLRCFNELQNKVHTLRIRGLDHEQFLRKPPHFVYLLTASILTSGWITDTTHLTRDYRPSTDGHPWFLGFSPCQQLTHPSRVVTQEMLLL